MADADGSWVVTGIEMGSGRRPPLPGTRLTLTVEDGRASGTSGCNRFTGPVTAEEGGRLTFGLLATTLMACPEPVMAQEQIFLSLLGRVDEALRLDGSLHLLAGGTVVVTLASAGVGVEGEWRLVAYSSDRALEAPASDVTAFFDGGTVSGSSGCNRYRADYRVAGASIEIGPAMTTRMACPPDVMELEGRVLEAMGRVASFRRDGEVLELLDGEGRPLLRFTAPAGENPATAG